MSLLMQALKKAEQAKQQTDEPASHAPAEKKHAPAAPDGLSLSPMEPAAPAPEPPATSEAVKESGSLTLSMEEVVRDAPAAAPVSPAPAEPPAPVVQASMEPLPVLSPPPDPAPDVATPEPAAPPATVAKTPAPEPQPAPPAQAAVRMPTPAAAPRPQAKTPSAQQTAKTVFASKQVQRKGQGLRIALGAILVLLLASAGFGYYYIQSLTQKSSVLAAGTPAQPPVAPEPAVPAQPAEATGASSAASATLPAATSPASEISSGKLTAGQIAPPAETGVPVKNSAVAEKPAMSEGEPKAMLSPAANKPASMGNSITIRQTSNVDHVNPALASAYQAFVAGDTASAQQKYQQVLQHDSTNRDALLGLAAIAIQRKQTAQAGALYVKLLELDPNDADAVAGLTSLQQGNLAQNESRLKKIAAENPNAVAVQFVLGNLYAQQSRWAEAQQAYFQAFGGAPGNADYAFNLAVSLDRLSQTKLALEYYQRALMLAQNGSGNFSKSAVQTRIRELQSLAEN